MSFTKLLLRFIPQFKWRIIAYIVLNFICSICSVFSFIAIIPFVQVLFGLSNETFQYVSLSEIVSFSNLLDVAKNNIMYYLQLQISTYGKVGALFMIGGFVVVMSFLSNLISYFAYWVRIPIRTGISRDLRKDAYHKIVNMPYSAFSKENRGDFVSRMTNDVEEIEYGIGTTLDMFIKDPVQIIVYIVTMFGISSQLTLYGLLLLLSTCTLILVLGKTMQSISFIAQTKRGMILSFFEQTLGVLPLIKSHNAEQTIEGKFNTLNISAQKTFNKQNRFYSLAWPCTDFLIVSIIVVMLCVGGRLILTGQSSFGPAALIGFLGVFYSLIIPVRDMMKCTFGIRKAIASVSRLNKVLSIEDEQNQGNKIWEINETHNNIPLIDFDDVSFKFDEVNCLQNISLKIYTGQKIAILGDTGVGKSTMANLIVRLFDNHAGCIKLSGVDIKQYDKKSIRDNISYVTQDPLLLNDTIYNNICFGLGECSKESVIAAAQRVHIHDFIMSLPDGYETVIGDRGMNLSGGQRQCVALARAVLKDSPIIVLDEATASLDLRMEDLIMKEMDSFCVGKTMIYITHSIDAALKADYVYLFRQGKVHKCGTPDEITINKWFLDMV